MGKQASLHKVRDDENGVVFVINAPAVAAALARSNGSPSAAMQERFVSALGTMPELQCSPTDGKWYARVERKAPAACTREAVRKNRQQRMLTGIADNDGTVAGRCRCGRCDGTGRYIVGTENGKPKFGGGECYHCAGKGWHDQADRRRNYGADVNYVCRGH